MIRNISIVIPALDAEDYLPPLLTSIEAQTLLADEIVIVDSSLSSKTADLLRKWKGPIPIVCKRVDFAYPGHARNIGVNLAKGEWIAFLDCRTLPGREWLETSASIAERSEAEFVGALCVSDADTHFKQVLRAATYGCAPIETVVGSIVSKKVFEQAGGFIADVRAGEDIEWLHRLKNLNIKIGKATTPTIRYDGLVRSLSEAIKKWCLNNFAITDIEVKNNQKAIYLLLFIVLMSILAYKWNAVVAEWNEESILYIPNITKIFVAAILVSYVVYRGIIRPLQVMVGISFLLPWRWLEISLVGLCLDLAKAPGLIWGAILLLKRRIGRI